ncbi:MAG: hypothetical protein ACD_20C00337G0029 [uncultured bacterium]|nr:MAG: hypothetical protein ACD_20C00337G0029 [uncultured bacterium]
MVRSIQQNNNFTSAQFRAQSAILSNRSQFVSDVFKDFYFIKPTALPPKGQLIQGSMLPKPKDLYNEYKDAAKTFYKALKGEGGDYQIGKLNDSAVGLGSLAIASILSSKGATPMAKTMEFVGFGTWFLAMSIWPKFFVGKPLKALTGVDINQEYIDSQGRKKRFFEDPQYHPWDLMSDKQINEVGKKLRIPENIESRKEVIQNKMTQVATQANTLWMLTAGFSTPILSSLIADQLRKPIKTIIGLVNTEIANVKLKAASGATDFISNFVNRLTDMKMVSNEKKLNELLAQGNTAGIKDFFAGVARKFNSNEIRSALSEKAAEVSKNTNKEEVLGFYKNVHNLLKSEKALYGYQKASLVNKIGNSWIDVSKNILKTLKMPKDVMKKLADANTGQRADIIAQHLHGLGAEELGKIANDAGIIPKGPVSTARHNQVILLNSMRKTFKKALNSVFDKDTAKGTFEQVKDRLGNRLLDITSSFDGISNVLTNSKGKNPAVIAKLLGGIKSPDAWTELTEIMKKGGEEALRSKLGEALTNRKAVDKIVNVIKSQDQSQIKSLSSWLGQTPKDLLADAAKDLTSYQSWFKKVGLIGGGVLLGITLLTILRMGKSNSYNPDVYKYKEVAGNEPSK